MPEPSDIWELELYIADDTPFSLLAINNLKRICEEYLPNKCNIQVFDLYKQPKLAKEREITALPTLIHRKPSSARKLVGNLSNTERVINYLGIPAKG